MLLNEEKMVLENDGLVHHVLLRLGYNQTYQDYEDVASVGRIGLIKAVKNFDETKKVKFATYAVVCIENEIYMYFRRNNKHKFNISLDEIIFEGICVMDILESPNSYFEEKIEDNEEFIQIVYYILNCLKGKEKFAILYSLAQKRQSEIGLKLNITQSYASRLINKGVERVKKIIEKKLIYEERFSIKLVDKVYYLTFRPDCMEKFKDFSISFFKHVSKFPTEIPKFKLTCNNERCTIQIVAGDKAFYFIAELVKELDKNKITILSQKKNTSSEVDNRNNALNVKEYILNLDANEFTIQEIIRKFPKENQGKVRSMIFYMKSKGLIKPKGRGIYEIVKDN